MGILGETIVSQGHYEINWPLVFQKSYQSLVPTTKQQKKSENPIQGSQQLSPEPRDVWGPKFTSEQDKS